MSHDSCHVCFKLVCSPIVCKAIVSWESHCGQGGSWNLVQGWMEAGRSKRKICTCTRHSCVLNGSFMLFMTRLATFSVQRRCKKGFRFEISLCLVKPMRNQPRQAFEHLQSWMSNRVATLIEKQPRLKSQSNVAELLAILNDDSNEVGRFVNHEGLFSTVHTD